MPVPVFTVRPRRHRCAAPDRTSAGGQPGADVLTGQASDPVFPGAGDADGAYVMNADGSGERRLTSDAASARCSRRTARRSRTSATGIAIANADGGGSHVVACGRPTTTTDASTSP